MLPPVPPAASPASGRLDRLSALLDGLSTSITIHHAGPLTESLSLPASPATGLRLHLLLTGASRLRLVEAGKEELRLCAPMAVLLQSSRANELTPAAEGASLLAASVSFAGPAGAALHAAFAAPVVLALDDVGSDLAPLLAMIETEVNHPRCGHRSFLTHAVEILLIAFLRHIIARPGVGSGVLAALADVRIARAVVAMNENPGQPWSLESLAEAAGMSRTAFSQSFRQRMNITPGKYLAGLRLALAEQSVAAGQGLKQAARAAGYASPATLSRALSLHRRRQDGPGVRFS